MTIFVLEVDDIGFLLADHSTVWVAFATPLRFITIGTARFSLVAFYPSYSESRKREEGVRTLKNLDGQGQRSLVEPSHSPTSQA